MFSMSFSIWRRYQNLIPQMACLLVPLTSRLWTLTAFPAIQFRIYFIASFKKPLLSNFAGPQNRVYDVMMNRPIVQNDQRKLRPE